MSPLEIWCNESQERYVLAIDPDRIPDLAALCERERCPWADVGEATRSRRLEVRDARFDSAPVSMPLSVLLGGLPRLHRDAAHATASPTPPADPPADRKRVRSIRGATAGATASRFRCSESPTPPADPPADGRRARSIRGAFDTRGIEAGPALERVLRMPAVADKSFLVTIGDRSVGGLVARDQMVGPWQVPVADCAVTLSDFRACTGEAVAMGERAPVALLDARAAARLAVVEALTNVAAADVADVGQVALSANWMAACGAPGEDANLYDAVEAVAMELCPALGVPIPVGKDSLSMRTVWRDESGSHEVVSPVSLVVSAFAPVEDARLSLTPMLRTDVGESALLLIDLGNGAERLGGSALALAYGRLGAEPPDLGPVEAVPALFRALARLRREGRAAAYHDRSDGGLAVCVLEMAFAGRAAIDVDVGPLGADPIAALFCEAPGAVLQVREADPRRGPRGLRRRAAARRSRPPDRDGRNGRPRAFHGRRGRSARSVPHRAAPGVVGDLVPDAAPARRSAVRGGGIRPHRRREGARTVVRDDVRRRRRPPLPRLPASPLHPAIMRLHPPAPAFRSPVPPSRPPILPPRLPVPPSRPPILPLRLPAPPSRPPIPPLRLPVPSSRPPAPPPCPPALPPRSSPARGPGSRYFASRA